MSFTDIVSKFNQQADSHSRSQTLNPFSDRFEQSRSPSPRFSREEYGKPVAGSKTDLRGRKAKSHICREILELCTVIHDVGTYNSKKKGPDDEDNGIDDGTIIVSFGELFQIYTKISDKVVGLLIAAKRRGFVYFDREILFQRQDEDVLIALIKPITEIAKILKADIEQTNAPAAEQTEPGDKHGPSSSSDERGRTKQPARNNHKNNNCNGQVCGVDGGVTNSMLNNVVEISENKRDRDGGARADATEACTTDRERVEEAETEKIVVARAEGAEATEGVEGPGEVEGVKTEGIEEAKRVEGVEKTERAEGVNSEGIEDTERVDGVNTEGVEGTERVEGVNSEGVEETERVERVNTEGVEETERVEGTGENEEIGEIEGVTTEGIVGLNTERAKGTEKTEGIEGITATDKVEGVKTERVVETGEVEGVDTERTEETEENGGIKTEKIGGVNEEVERTEEFGEVKTEIVEETEKVEETDKTRVINIEMAEGTGEVERTGEIKSVETEIVEEQGGVGGTKTERVEEQEGVGGMTTEKIEGMNAERETEGMQSEGTNGSGNESESDNHSEDRVPEDSCPMDVVEKAKEVGETENVSSFFGDGI